MCTMRPKSQSVFTIRVAPVEENTHQTQTHENNGEGTIHAATNE